MSITEAIALLKANGYRVTKPKPRKKDRVGPTFVATFAGGDVIRMSVNTSHENPDFAKGRRMARHAWASRVALAMTLTSADLIEICPPIKAEHFEVDGKMIALAERRAA